MDKLIEEAFEKIEPDDYLSSVNNAIMADAFNGFLSNLYGPDPFADVYDTSDAHRYEHGLVLPGGEQECGVFPSNQIKMRVITGMVRATNPRRVLEIGGGLGYSALWLASAMGPGGSVETIDRFPEHITQLRSFAGSFGLSGRITAIEGEGDVILPGLPAPYDVIHDDGWFAKQPAYYETMIGLLKPGGLLIMSNWFLLEHAVTGESSVDWSLFAGDGWADDIKAYADTLTRDARLDVSFVPEPAFALAVKRANA